jgi:hypothetical protein
MRLLGRLESRFGSLAIPNLTIYLAFGQFCCLLLTLARPELADKIELIPEQVIAGEWWRLFTFVFVPGFGANPLFAAFALYFFWLIGTALENHWGEFRFNLFVLIGYLAAVGASFLSPEMPATNSFVNGSMFIAFAILYPDLTINLMFIFPVKVKWLAVLMLVMDCIALMKGPWGTRVMVLASLLNVILFFRRELAESLRNAGRQMQSPSRRAAFKSDGGVPFHTCAACGITDRSHPKMEFRYCPQCVGGVGYCMDHIQNHEHRAAATSGAPSISS